MMLAGVAGIAIVVAAPAFAVDREGPAPRQVAAAVPTVQVNVKLPLPVPTVQVQLPAPVPTVNVQLPAPTAVPIPTVRAQLPAPTVVPVPTVRVPLPTAVPTTVPTTVPVPVPTVRVPVPTVVAPPSTGGGSSSGGSSSGGSSGSGSTAPAGGTTTAAPGRAAAPANGGSSAGGSAPAATQGGTGARPAPRGPASHRADRSHERWLRQTVTSREACLGDLSRPERHVLVLRAGVGPGAPLSRARVARRLDMTVRRVARLEQDGLRRLRELCRGASTGTTKGKLTADHLAASPAAAAAGPLGAGTTTRAGTGTAPARRGATNHAGYAKRGSPEPTGDALGSVAGVSARHSPSVVNLTIPLVLILLAFGTWAVVRARRGKPGAVAEPDVPTELPPPPPRIAMPPVTRRGPSWTDRPRTGNGDAAPWSGSDRAGGEPAPDDPV